MFVVSNFPFVLIWNFSFFLNRGKGCISLISFGRIIPRLTSVYHRICSFWFFTSSTLYFAVPAKTPSLIQILTVICFNAPTAYMALAARSVLGFGEKHFLYRTKVGGKKLVFVWTLELVYCCLRWFFFLAILYRRSLHFHQPYKLTREYNPDNQ